MLCTNCNNETNRPWWTRAYPHAYLCRKCWEHPEDVSPVIRRREMAIILWEARSVSRTAAHQLKASMLGKGVPANPKHGRRMKNVKPSTGSGSTGSDAEETQAC